MFLSQNNRGGIKGCYSYLDVTITFSPALWLLMGFFSSMPRRKLFPLLWRDEKRLWMAGKICLSFLWLRYKSARSAFEPAEFRTGLWDMRIHRQLSSCSGGSSASLGAEQGEESPQQLYFHTDTGNISMLLCSLSSCLQPLPGTVEVPTRAVCWEETLKAAFWTSLCRFFRLFIFPHCFNCIRFLVLP